MELRVLNYFLAVAREENFTKAANMLHVTQPTLSRQIADLEQELGVKLFVRSNHNIVLTEDGMILKRRAQEILSLADKTNEILLKKRKRSPAPFQSAAVNFVRRNIWRKSLQNFAKNIPT